MTRVTVDQWQRMWDLGWREFTDSEILIPSHRVQRAFREAYAKGWAERSRFELDQRRSDAEAFVGERCPMVRIVWGNGIREYPNRLCAEARRA